MRYYRIRVFFLFGLLAFLLVGISVIFMYHDSTYSAPIVKESQEKSFSFTATK